MEKSKDPIIEDVDKVIEESKEILAEYDRKKSTLNSFA
jgi:hypothetical protein